MQWTSYLATPEMLGKDACSIARDLSKSICQDIKVEDVDLVIAFITPDFAGQYEEFANILWQELKPKALVGCTALGLIGAGAEIEQERAVTITAAHLPGVNISTFALQKSDLPDADDAQSKWEAALGVNASDSPSFILITDPFSFNSEALVQGLDYAFPQAVKIGGLASGGNHPGVNALFHNQKIVETGAVGVALTGNIVVDTIVAQGCRPVGWPMRITRGQGNFLFELDDKPAAEALHEVLESLGPDEKSLAKHSLFLGVAMNEFKDKFSQGDFLIRNIVGLHAQSGALVVGEVMHNERTVQFQLRDAATSAEELKFLLKAYRDENKTEAGGALLFSCLGRGSHLYGYANHDSNCFRQYLGEIPLGGFFCNGEIGPVGGQTFLHGYTSSFGIFRTKEKAG